MIKWFFIAHDLRHAPKDSMTMVKYLNLNRLYEFDSYTGIRMNLIITTTVWQII